MAYSVDAVQRNQQTVKTFFEQNMQKTHHLILDTKQEDPKIVIEKNKGVFSRLGTVFYNVLTSCRVQKEEKASSFSNVVAYCIENKIVHEELPEAVDVYNKAHTQKIDKDKVERVKRMALSSAIEANNKAQVRSLVQNMDTTQEDLVSACKLGFSRKTLEAIMERAIDKDPTNALFAVCSNPYVKPKQIQLFLDEGAQVEGLEEGITPLVKLLKVNASYEAIEFLANKRQNGFVDAEGSTELHYAVLYGCRENVLQILNKDTPNNNGQTALHIAAQSGNKEAVQFLMNTAESYASFEEYVEKKDNQGNTPYMLAHEKGHTEVALQLDSRNMQLPFEEKKKIEQIIDTSDKQKVNGVAAGSL